MINDPRILKVKWTGKCATCQTPLPKGTNAYYWPIGKKLVCLACGDEDYKRFQESVWDEENYYL